MILTCKHYRHHYETKFKIMTTLLQNNDDFDFVFVCGNNNQHDEFVYNETEKMVYAKCGDYYEDLQIKVFMGIKYILKTFNDVNGIFKTDDNAAVKDGQRLLELLLHNKSIDYFGFFNDNKKRIPVQYTLKNYRLKQFHNPEPYRNKKFLSSQCCYGFGYYISLKSCDIVLDNYDIVKNEVLEDMCIGIILNKNNIYPQHIEGFDDTVLWDKN